MCFYRYRPDLVDLTTLKGLNVKECNELAFMIIERELGVPRAISAIDSVTLENVDSKIWLNYLEQVCEVFRGEIPHVKHPKLDLEKIRETKTAVAPDFSRLLKYTSARKTKSPSREIDRIAVVEERSRRPRRSEHTTAVLPAEGTAEVTTRRARKRRSYEKFGNIVRFCHLFPHFQTHTHLEQSHETEIKASKQYVLPGRTG